MQSISDKNKIESVIKFLNEKDPGSKIANFAKYLGDILLCADKSNISDHLFLVDQTFRALEQFGKKRNLALTGSIAEEHSGFSVIHELLDLIFISGKPGYIEFKGNMCWGTVFFVGDKIVASKAGDLDNDYKGELALKTLLKQEKCEFNFYADLDVIRKDFGDYAIQHLGTGHDYLLDCSTEVENEMKDAKKTEDAYPPYFIPLLSELIEQDVLYPWIAKIKQKDSQINDSTSDSSALLLMFLAEEHLRKLLAGSGKIVKKIDISHIEEYWNPLRDKLLRQIVKPAPGEMKMDNIRIFNEAKNRGIERETGYTFGNEIFGIGDICRSLPVKGMIRLLIPEEGGKSGTIGTLYLDKNRIVGAMIENIAEKGCGDLSENNIVSAGKNAAHRIIASSKDFAIFQVQRIINPDFKKNIPTVALIENPEPAMWTVLEAEESLLVYQKMLPRRTQLELVQPLQSTKPISNIEDKIVSLLSTNLTIDRLSSLLFADKKNIEKNYMHYEARQELTDVVIYEKIFSLIKDGKIKIRRNYEDLSAEMPYIEYECQMLSKRLGLEDDKPSELVITFFNQQSEKSIASIILKGEEVKTAESLAMIRQKELLETAEESSQDKLQRLFEEGLKAIEDDMSRDDMESWSRINKAETIKDDFYSILTGLIQNFHIPGYIYVEVSQNEAYKNRISRHLDKILEQPDVLAYLLFNYSKPSYDLESRKDIDNLIPIQNLFKQKETSMHDESLVKLLENNPLGLIEQVKKNIGGKFTDKIYNISDGKSERGTIILKKINDNYFLFLILLKKTEKNGVAKISVKKELLDSINELKILIDGK